METLRTGREVVDRRKIRVQNSITVSAVECFARICIASRSSRVQTQNTHKSGSNLGDVFGLLRAVTIHLANVTLARTPNDDVQSYYVCILRAVRKSAFSVSILPGRVSPGPSFHTFPHCTTTDGFVDKTAASALSADELPDTRNARQTPANPSTGTNARIDPCGSKPINDSNWSSPPATFERFHYLNRNQISGLVRVEVQERQGIDEAVIEASEAPDKGKNPLLSPKAKADRFASSFGDTTILSRNERHGYPSGDAHIRTVHRFSTPAHSSGRRRPRGILWGGCEVSRRRCNRRFRLPPIASYFASIKRSPLSSSQADNHTNMGMCCTYILEHEQPG